ncbi:MAG: acyl-ACP desaturase [Myxococcales bacterium]|nr:acyl-ACP desaturase [Myxococcales bacterium]
MAGFDIKRFLELAGAVKTDDLDWDACAKAGLTPHEARILRYMADTESHTILYMRDLLAGHSTRDPAITAFLSVWVYEELCHGRALSKVLEVCGYPEAEDHYTQVTTGSSMRELMEAVLSHGAAYLTPKFIAVHMTWGAINEAAAAVAYQRLEKLTANPVLATLCNRMARQERRHFSFYYHQAKARMEGDRVAQFLTYTAIKRFWTLVGSGVAGDDNLAFVAAHLFPDEASLAILDKAEKPIRDLPRLDWFHGVTEGTRAKAAEWRAANGEPAAWPAPPVLEPQAAAS